MFAFWKKSSDSFKHSFLIIIAYGVAFGIGYLTRLYNPPIHVYYYLSEHDKIVGYQLNLKDVLDLVFIGPIFTIFSFFLLRRILTHLSENGHTEHKVIFAYVVFLIAIVLFNYGNIIHVTMNRLNSQIRDEYGTEQVYYSVYYLDEIIGHHFLTIGFFIIFVENCALHTLNLSKSLDSGDPKILMNPTEKKWNYVFGSLLGAITAFAYLEGQSAFLFLILNPIFSGLLIIYSLKKKIKIQENSLLMLFLLMTVVFSVVTILWGILFGIKPYYPYFYQNSEL